MTIENLAERLGSTTAKQLEHRANLVEFWRIKPGWSVLEIGCGGGVTAILLAQAVGSSGRVVGIDSAPGGYGEPWTMDRSTREILELGLPCVPTFHTETDIMQNPAILGGETFDAVVPAHSAWYMHSEPILEATLRVVREHAQTLAFAEWDLAASHADQLPHLAAVLAQQQLVSELGVSAHNVRLPLGRRRIGQIIADVGWLIGSESDVATPLEYEDAHWEVDIALDMLNEPATEELSKELQVCRDYLTSCLAASTGRSLDAFALTAT